MTEETQRKLEKCKCSECVYNNLMFHIFHNLVLFYVLQMYFSVKLCNIGLCVALKN